MSSDVERSDLIDTSYADLYTQLSNTHNNAQPTQLLASLKLRTGPLSNISNVFGRPSDASRQKIETGRVELADGVIIRVGEIDKAYVFAISSLYDIDQIQSLILMRSFFYNVGMPDTDADDATPTENAARLAEDIGAFYYAERLHALRVLIPLLRAREDEHGAFHSVAATYLPLIIPDGPKFARTVLEEYVRKTKEGVPERWAGDPRKAAVWARQNLKEQLVLLELLFWTMWGYVPCSGPLVVDIFSAAYASNLGSAQANGTLLLDDESRHMLEDCAAVWILITVEVLELETLGEEGAIELSDTPTRPDVYYSSPGSLQKLHELVTSHQSSQYSITFLAWTYVLSRLSARAAETPDAIPASYAGFLDSLNPPLARSYSKEREPLHVQMVKACLEPEVGLFKLLHHLLTQSPLFVTSVAWKRGSSVTDINAVAYRSVIKGLIVALLDIHPLELFPSLSQFTSLWLALFGRSEPPSVSGIAAQFWTADWGRGIARRAVLDVARSRFPVRVRPLMRLLRAMTGAGFLDTDPLYVADPFSSSSASSGSDADPGPGDDRTLCAGFVYHFFAALPSYTQVIPLSACTGPHALYERQTERAGGGSTAATAPPAYINLRPLRLPGGSILPARSVGRVLSADAGPGGGESVVVCWQHRHSGWKVILEVLTDYVNRRRNDYASGGGGGGGGGGVGYGGVSFAPRAGTGGPKALRIEEVGIDMDDDEADDLDDDTEGGGAERTVTDALDLVRSVIKDNPAQAAVLMRGLEDGEPVVCHSVVETQPPDLVQLTMMILEEALGRTGGGASGNVRMNANWSRNRSGNRNGTGEEGRTRLITSAMAVLAALLAIPAYSNRVWLYVRNTTMLFGNGGSGARGAGTGFAAAALAKERATGRYTMTLALLHLVESLFAQAYGSINLGPEGAKLMQLKEEVLLRAMRFVHAEVWVEHLGWKYVMLGDRFEIGRMVVGMYVRVLVHSPPSAPYGAGTTTAMGSEEGKAEGEQKSPFALLSQAVSDVLLFKSTTSTITPLVSTLASGDQMLTMLWAARRLGDVRRLIFLLNSTLRLCRLILTFKLDDASVAGRVSLLEQALCARASGGAPGHDRAHVRLDPIDVLGRYVLRRDVDTDVPVEATKLLSALLASLAGGGTHSPTVIGHLANPETTVAALVRIVQHPYDELRLRKAVWGFVALAVDREPALARLVVTGRSSVPGEFKEVGDPEGKGKEGGKEKETEKGKEAGKAKEKELVKQDANVMGFKTNALDAACNMLVNWKDIWDANPLVLSCVFRFLDAVWQHALEHKAVLEPLRANGEFWERVVGVACQEVGPVPEYHPSEVVFVDGVRRSSLHEGIQAHAYRSLVKAHAIHIITRDIGMHLLLHGSDVPLKKPESYKKLEPFLKSQDDLTDLLAEAAPSSYAPQLHDEAAGVLKDRFAGLTLQQLEVREMVSERDYGDNFAFLVPLLRLRLQAYPLEEDAMEDPAEAVEKLVLSINLNLSLAHSEVALIEAWDALLRQVVPYVRMDATVRPHVLAIAASISYDIAAEAREGDMMASIHGARLSLVLALLEVAWFSSSDKKPELESFMELTRNLSGIILNEAQSPSRSFLSPLPNPFHRTLLQILFYFAKQARSLLNRPKTLNAEQRLTISSTVEVVLGFVIDALRVVFLAASSRADVDLERDMELLVAVFEQCTRPDLATSSVFWLARCQETDVIRASLDLYSHIDLVGLSDLPLLLSKRQPLYSPHILLFHMALAKHPVAAERLASEGLLVAYSNNFISSAISSGHIDIVLAELPGQRSPAHLAYCSMLSIVAMVITALGRQNHYFDAEACGFVQLYGDQISRALSWTIGEAVTLPLLEEIDQVVNLFYSLAASVPSAAKSNPMVDKVLRVFTSHALQLLQQINYAITHPNHLATLYEPVTQDERVKYEKAQTQPDPVKRPIVMHLIHRLFQLSSNIVGTLVVISRADTVLSGGVDDWPIHEALVVPHSKVVLGEPASLGTLLELGNRTLDVLKDLVQRPAGQSIADPSALSGSYTTTLGVTEGIVIARRNLEEILLYSVTQLAMWLSKPDFDSAPLDPEDDPQAMIDSSRPDGTKERRGPRASMTMAERLRRGMTGEMAGDLQSLLTKSRSVMAAADKTIGKPSVDITQILIGFLHERVSSSS